MEPHSLVNGALRLVQPDEKSGLRVNVDTVLLAHFARPKAGERILEIGCAHGAISLILAKRGTLLPQRGFDVTGVDIRPDLVGLARANAESNGLKAEFVAADVREYKKNRSGAELRQNSGEPALRRSAEQPPQPQRRARCGAPRLLLHA